MQTLDSTSHTGDDERPLVLVIDDDAAFRLTVRTTVENAGFDVEEAEDGQHALEVFSRVRPDLVLLDILMPGMDGFATCNMLRQLPAGTHTPILVMTGLEDADSIKRAYDVGATDFVTKPINYLILTHRMRYVLRANRYLVHFDELTGLPNRRIFLEHLRQALASSRRYERSLGVLFIGLDYFKRFNETLGYAAGDQLLRQVSKRLRNSLRNSDVVSRSQQEQTMLDAMPRSGHALARLGGDEFVIALTEVQNAQDVDIVVQRVKASLDQRFYVAGNELHVTASIGTSAYPLDGDDPQVLLKHAEVAMNHAKEQGRNRHQSYSEALNARNRKRFSIETQLRRALDREEFEVHYQPKLDLQSDRVVGTEALIRWPHPELGMVPPLEFIPIAEETGLILPLSEWVLGTACAQAVRCHERGWSELTVAVNLSAVQLKQKRLARQVARIVEDNGLAPHCVELELTENLLVEDIENSVRTLAQIKDAGLSVSVDDFGTGYSSLNYLKRFSLDSLKIDRSFVQDIVSDGDDAQIIKAVIALAHALGLKVVAEGVESADQLEFLRAQHCDQVQGFYFAPALSEKDLSAWLAQWRPGVGAPESEIALPAPGSPDNKVA